MIDAAIEFLKACGAATHESDGTYKLPVEIVDEVCAWINQELEQKRKPSRLRALPPDPDVLDWLRDGIDSEVISFSCAAELLDMSVSEAVELEWRWGPAS